MCDTCDGQCVQHQQPLVIASIKACSASLLSSFGSYMASNLCLCVQSFIKNKTRLHALYADTVVGRPSVFFLICKRDAAAAAIVCPATPPSKHNCSCEASQEESMIAFFLTLDSLQPKKKKKKSIHGNRFFCS